MWTKVADKLKPPKPGTTTCDACGTTIDIKEAVKESAGSGTSNYFCDEDCQQDHRDGKEDF